MNAPSRITRWIFLLGVLTFLVALSSLGHLLRITWSLPESSPVALDDSFLGCSLSNYSDTSHSFGEDVLEDWDSSRFLNGSPTLNFRGVFFRLFHKVRPPQRTLDNLLHNASYITAWSNAGFSSFFHASGRTYLILAL